MEVFTPTHEFGSSGIISGDLNVVNRLEVFLSNFEAFISAEIDNAVSDQRDSIRKEAANHPDWAGIAESLNVEFVGGRIVYSVDDSASDVAANNEYGVDPKPLLRTHAMKAARELSTKLSKSVSKGVPVA